VEGRDSIPATAVGPAAMETAGGTHRGPSVARVDSCGSLVRWGAVACGPRRIPSRSVVFCRGGCECDATVAVRSGRFVLGERHGFGSVGSVEGSKRPRGGSTGRHVLDLLTTRKNFLKSDTSTSVVTCTIIMAHNMCRFQENNHIRLSTCVAT
jgi:hypothetical protein